MTLRSLIREARYVNYRIHLPYGLTWTEAIASAVVFVAVIAVSLMIPALIAHEHPTQSRHPQSHAWSTPGEPG